MRSPAPWVFTVSASLYVLGLGTVPGFRDSGELGAAAHGLGVAHPTGFPLDLLLLRAAEFLPLGTIGFRQNLAVALVSAAVLALLAELIFRSGADPQSPDRERRASVDLGPGAARWLMGVLGAVALGTWETFVRSALSVEVYSTALCLVALAAVACTNARGRPVHTGHQHREGGQARFSDVGSRCGLGHVGTLGLLFGLSLGAHVVARFGLLMGLGTAVWMARRHMRAAAVAVGASGIGALVLIYLPLASAAEPAIDWGDPQTFGRFWEHWTAARIRSAYAGAMGLDARSAGRLAEQLAELWPWLWLSTGAALAVRSARGGVLGAVLLISTDLAYGVMINPMGVADRQVGHVAGAALCFLGGLGGSELAERFPRKMAGPLLPLVGLVLSAVMVCRGPWAFGRDPDAADELLGGGGPLVLLPPRSVLVCRADDVCAASWFALHAEGARPDVRVVPAQHLWEPTIRSPLTRCAPDLHRFGRHRPEPGAPRARLAGEVESRLAHGGCPVFWDGTSAAGRVPARFAPWLVRSTSPYATEDPREPLFALDGLWWTGQQTVQSHPLAREAWSRAYGWVGAGALQMAAPDVAVQAYGRAVRITPDRALPWQHLGVALVRRGDLAGALQATLRALELDPHLATSWVNLIEFQLAAGDSDAARRTLAQAALAVGEDVRLQALRRRLVE